MKQVATITLNELRAMADKMYGTLVKADVLSEEVRSRIRQLIAETVHE